MGTELSQLAIESGQEHRSPCRLGVLRVIARKELTDAFRNGLFVAALVMLLGLSFAAVGIGAVTVHQRVADYRQSVQILQQLGRTDVPPMPTMNPLAVSKTFITYLSMAGALLAMILGFSSIEKERRAGTLNLILSRPVFRDQFLTGKIVGNGLLIGALMVAVGLATWGGLLIVGNVALDFGQLTKLGLTMLMSWLYLMTFFLLALFFGLWVSNGDQALLLAIIVWLIFAFILPQIGDTMDLDNQLPGGFFASLGLDKAGEQAALAKFKLYETLRDTVEELSPTKHFERITFALLGIKAQFASSSGIEILRMKIVNLVGLLVPIVLLLVGSYTVFLRRDT